MDTQEIDLFTSPDKLPKKVRKVLDTWQEDSYEECERMLKELRPLGYTFEYYLDGTPFNLRLINP